MSNQEYRQSIAQNCRSTEDIEAFMQRPHPFDKFRARLR
jgi:hypothetical protein